jgi:hypothetical protein
LGRLGQLRGSKNFKPQQSDYDKIGRSAFLKQAEDLEKRKLVTIKWYDGKSEILNIKYSMDILPTLYEMAGKAQPRDILADFHDAVEAALAQSRKDWIAAYLRSLLAQLEKGNIPSNLRKPGFFACIKGLDSLREPTYKRIFSAGFLSDSKQFEKDLQKTILSAARKHCADIDDAMDDSQALEQIFLEDYAPQLYVKGNLRLTLDEKRLELSDYKYGVTLNSKTLKQAEILPEQNIRRVVTIENKTNFEAAAFENGTLFIFTHGFLSPREREFLLRLRNALDSRSGPDGPIAYLHSGDLDYGGVRIFQYMRKTVFPEVQPLLMDAKTYRKYREMAYGTPIEPQTLGKLQGVQEPLLQDLIDLLIAEGYGIEQECFLFADRKG